MVTLPYAARQHGKEAAGRLLAELAESGADPWYVCEVARAREARGMAPLTALRSVVDDVRAGVDLGPTPLWRPCAQCGAHDVPDAPEVVPVCRFCREEA